MDSRYSLGTKNGWWNLAHDTEVEVRLNKEGTSVGAGILPSGIADFHGVSPTPRVKSKDLMEKQ